MDRLIYDLQSLRETLLPFPLDLEKSLLPDKQWTAKEFLKKWQDPLFVPAKMASE
jgi:hypothetical protein